MASLADILSYLFMIWMETSSRKCRLKIIKKTLVISKWTEKRHLILQNSDLDFYIASNGVALKADFEKSYFLPTVQIKDEKKGYSAHVYRCYITVDDELVREHVVMKVLDGKIISYKLADKEVYIWCDIVDDNNPLPF